MAIIKEGPFKLSVYSRFKKTSDYSKILESLNEDLVKCGNINASELVNKTHKKSSHWGKVFQGG